MCPEHPDRAASGGSVPDWLQRLRNSPEHERRFFAQVTAAILMSALSALVELAVPLLRLLIGKKGIHLGPPIGSQLAFIVGWSATSRIAQRSKDESGKATSDSDGPLGGRALEIAAVGLPMLAALLPSAVVGRSRSPLWGWALLPLPRVVGSFLMGWSAGRRKTKRDLAQPRQPTPQS